MNGRRIGMLLFALAVAGCSGRSESAKVELTERQRDSVLARSDLPGARTVGRAMSESDRATRRVAALDSLSH